MKTQTLKTPFSARYLQKVEKVNNKMLCSLSRGAESRDCFTPVTKGSGSTTL